MRPPLVAGWRVALGVMGGAVIGGMAGLTLFGAEAHHSEPLVHTTALSALAGGAWVWLWERRQAREVSRARRRLAPRRRRGSGSDNWPQAGV